MKSFNTNMVGIALLLFASTFTMAQTESFKILSGELQILQKQLVPDKRVAILNFELKDTLQPRIVLCGETDLPNAKAQILKFLDDKNILFIDSLRLLPDVVIGEKKWALATLSVSNIRVRPEDASELASQVMMGTPLKVLDYVDKWYRVQTPESYIGWIDSSGLKTFSTIEMERWKKSDRYLYIANSGFAYENDEVVTDLVLGDLFEVISKKRGLLLLKTPDGRRGYVSKTDCISFDEWASRQPNVNLMVRYAKQMMGSPYLWGGTSTKATDCSGFVKLTYYSQGIILARDASQQAKYGEAIDFSDRNNLQPGDLLFFGSSVERIRHVGIYLGNGNFIHSSGRVYISSINPSDPKFIPSRNNVAARRILNSLDTEGIIRVKNHPWYTIQL